MILKISNENKNQKHIITKRALDLWSEKKPKLLKNKSNNRKFYKVFYKL
jgi:hypothetical protein